MSNEEQTDPLSILTEDLGNVDLTPTVPAKGATTRARIVKIEHRPSLSGHPLIAVDVETLSDCEAYNKPGVKVEPGYRRTHYISLNPTTKDGKDRRESIERDLKRLRFAATGEDTGSFAPIEQYINQEVVVLWDVEESEEFGIQARVKRFMRPENV